MFLGWTFICDLYLFHFIVLLNHIFNCSKSFASFSFDKVTTGTYSFVSAIWNVAPDRTTIAESASASTVISTKTQFFDQVEISSTFQLMKRICKLLQKLLKCFIWITTSAFVNESLSSGVFPTILVLYLKDSELEARGLLGSSL